MIKDIKFNIKSKIEELNKLIIHDDDNQNHDDLIYIDGIINRDYKQFSEFEMIIEKINEIKINLDKVKINLISDLKSKNTIESMEHINSNINKIKLDIDKQNCLINYFKEKIDLISNF